MDMVTVSASTSPNPRSCCSMEESIDSCLIGDSRMELASEASEVECSDEMEELVSSAKTEVIPFETLLLLLAAGVL